MFKIASLSNKLSNILKLQKNSLIELTSVKIKTLKKQIVDQLIVPIYVLDTAEIFA